VFEELIKDPGLSRLSVDFAAGETVFFEDEPSRDLYFLAEGVVEVLKGQARIAQIAEAGAVFGEMSFLLGTPRSATVRALGPVRAIRVPHAQAEDLVRQQPRLSLEITKLLALRLERTSQTLFGLKELGDLLADAVVFTDEQGRVLSCNQAAQNLYGRAWPAVSGLNVAEFFADPQAFAELLAQARSKRQIPEVLLRARHPTRGELWVSASLTALFDAQHGFQGMIILGRDVTAAETLKHRMRRLRNWLAAAALAGAALAAGLFYWQPSFLVPAQAQDARQQVLRGQMARDFLLLQSLLGEPLAKGDLPWSLRLLKEFLAPHDPTAQPYLGLVILGKNKEVLGGQGANGQELGPATVGTTYAHIKFQGEEGSPQRVLALYRQDKDHAHGRRDLEMAFEIKHGQEMLGWLVFQLDAGALQSRFGLDEESLKALRFP
jgi:PAS domain S-box-containing protein